MDIESIGAGADFTEAIAPDISANSTVTSVRISRAGSDWTRGVAHSTQNLALSGFSWLHQGHLITSGSEGLGVALGSIVVDDDAPATISREDS